MDKEILEKQKKIALKKGKKYLLLWFRNQSGIFIGIFFLFFLFTSWIWYTYLYSLGGDREKVHYFLEQKTQANLDEESYNNLQIFLKERQENFIQEKYPKNLLERPPEGLFPEEE